MAEKIPHEIRFWIYSVVTAFQPVVAFYGLMSDNEAAMWVGVIGTVLGTGGTAMAATYTRKKSKEKVVTDDLTTWTNMQMLEDSLRRIGEVVSQYDHLDEIRTAQIRDNVQAPLKSLAQQRGQWGGTVDGS